MVERVANHCVMGVDQRDFVFATSVHGATARSASNVKRAGLAVSGKGDHGQLQIYLCQEIAEQPIDPPAFYKVHSRELHDFLDPSAMLFVIAMHTASLAFRLGIQRALGQSISGIGQEFTAFVAQAPSCSPMLLFAIDLDELLQDLNISLLARVGRFHRSGLRKNVALDANRYSVKRQIGFSRQLQRLSARSHNSCTAGHLHVGDRDRVNGVVREDVG